MGFRVHLLYIKGHCHLYEMILMIMIANDNWGLSFPDICLTVEEKPQETEIEPGLARWEATMLPLDHSSSQPKWSFWDASMEKPDEIEFEIQKSNNGLALDHYIFSGSIGSGTGSTQPREDNWVATWYGK